ncbi:hypothetical protein B0H63DRAFT_273340 [Podospora didyma]|uniref:FHA domain-containing protein n=1 Tax=Podospora didyma TaxID=330526 RepID=A0AAE0KFI0_9PEZI|nr:hypothetical protein B0H63DRAFT_273340 [Podospora didyma]
MEFYSVLFDQECMHCPVVYARDRQSFNGTYVNGQLVGKKPNISQARLLQHRDIVTIALHVTMLFSQALAARPSF